jgi:hypothetical protein
LHVAPAVLEGQNAEREAGLAHLEHVRRLDEAHHQVFFDALDRDPHADVRAFDLHERRLDLRQRGEHVGNDAAHAGELLGLHAK